MKIYRDDRRRLAREMGSRDGGIEDERGGKSMSRAKKLLEMVQVEPRGVGGCAYERGACGREEGCSGSLTEVCPLAGPDF